MYNTTKSLGMETLLFYIQKAGGHQFLDTLYVGSWFSLQQGWGSSGISGGNGACPLGFNLCFIIFDNSMGIGSTSCFEVLASICCKDVDNFLQQSFTGGGGGRVATGALAVMVSGMVTVSGAVTGARPATVPSNSASIFASKSSTISC